VMRKKRRSECVNYEGLFLPGLCCGEGEGARCGVCACLRDVSLFFVSIWDDALMRLVVLLKTGWVDEAGRGKWGEK